MAAAAAIPLDNGRADVFLSFCFSMGIGQPEYDSPDGIDPSPFKTVRYFSFEYSQCQYLINDTNFSSRFTKMR